MIRLSQQSEKNSPEEYDRIYFERQKKGVDEHDMRRWWKLLRYYEGGKLIDLGCLDSLTTVLANERYPKAEIWGVDIASRALASMAVDYPGIHYIWQDIQSTTFEYDYFDYAILGEVLEHSEHPAKIIHEAMRILKPGGVLAISVPLEEAKEPGAVDGERHIWSFSKRDMEEMLMPYGSVEMSIVGSLYSLRPPFYRYCWPSLICWCKKYV